MWAAVLACMVALGTPSLVSTGVVKSLYFVDTPISQKVVRGSEAVLSCSAAPSSSITDCRWTKEGVLLPSSLPRHSMRGCSLVISPVQLEDEGEYRCQVAGRNTSPLLSSPATLEVQVEPGRPSIVEAREGDWVEVERGEELLLTCESQGGRPHAEIQWRDAEGQIILGHAQEHITRIQDTNSFKTVSTLRFNPLQPMAVTCTAHSEAFPEVLRSNPLTVQLRRKVQEEQVMVRTGESTQLTCGEGGATNKWLLNDSEVEGETENTLNIEDFTSDYDNSVVKCLQEKVNGETRILKQFRLNHDTSAPASTKPLSLQADDGLAYDQPPPTKKPEKPAEDKKSNKNVFTCVSESDDVKSHPEYVWVNGILEKRVKPAKDSKGNGYKCRLIPGGMRKVMQMERKLKSMTKDLKRFSRTLKQFTAPVESR